jgi:hypothetical protein
MHAEICDFILDIVQNAVEAGASLIEVALTETESTLTCRVQDNGKGMTAKELSSARDPFYTDGIKHVGRKIGMGIPFLIQAAESAGGSVNIESDKGKGTECCFSFDRKNLDTPPLGDVPGTFLTACLLSCSLSCLHTGEYDLVLNRSLSADGRERSYVVTRSELSEALDGLETAGSLSLARMYLASLEDSLRGMEE